MVCAVEVRFPSNAVHG